MLYFAKAKRDWCLIFNQYFHIWTHSHNLSEKWWLSIKNAILRTKSWAKSQSKQAAVFFPNFLKITNMILNENTMVALEENYGPIKVNQKISIFGFEIWRPGKWNIRSGKKLRIENPRFWNPRKTEFETHNCKLLSQRAEKKVQNSVL